MNKQVTHSAKNAKYTSNTILECLAGMVRDEIIEEVKKSEQFAFIADETKDLKKKRTDFLCAEVLLKWNGAYKFFGIPRSRDIRCCRVNKCKNEKP